MELSRYTANAVQALSGAQSAAKRFGHSFVGSEHLLMGIIECGDRTAKLLNDSGVTAEAAAPYIDTVVGSGRSIFTDSFGNTQTVKKILELSLYESKSKASPLVDTSHILISIMRERDSLGARIIDSLCFDTDALRSALENGTELEPEADEEFDQSLGLPERFGRSMTPVLDDYTRDLTALARRGELDPVIGRDEEINRVLQTLCRRTKNNPVLIGDPGVGKTAVAEGIALKIIEGGVPRALSGARLLSLDLSAMIAGTKYRGEFEERLKTAIDELKDDPGIILFIDEIHNIVGAGAGEGSMDAANILKPALARGELRVIGATTVEEYRAHIEKDSALERRFTPIFISEPDAFRTKEILSGLKERYEKHHDVKLPRETVEAAVDLSVRFMADRRLPDKAIDLMDEACALVRIKAPNDACPTVTPSDIETVVADRTGIDMKAVNGFGRFDDIEKRLSERVFGQDKAIQLVSVVLRRAASGLSEPDKPFSSFVFFGPSGSGRRTLAEALADEAFGGQILSVNGSELADEHSAVKLLGTPTGYADSEKGGVLTEFLKLHPFSVILIEGADMASSGALSVLADLLKSGVAADGRGRLASLRSSVIILTVDADARNRSVGFESSHGPAESISSEMGRKLPQSLTSSVDAVVAFERLSRPAVKRIVEKALSRLIERAAKKHITLSVSDEAAEKLTELCGSSASEAERLVAVYAENALSAAVLVGEIVSGDSAAIKCLDGKIEAERV